MGVVFLALGASGLLDRVALLFPTPVVRGVQLAVGLLFLSLAWRLATSPPATFADADRPTGWLLVATALVVVLALALRQRAVALLLVLVGLGVAAATFPGPWVVGPAPIEWPDLDAAAFATAALVLVLPQVPLTFANSCVATADVAARYYGADAARVRVGRLATTLGAANLVAGGLGGMPVCHGAGGLTAHRAFGARTGGAPIVMGITLLVLALGLGASLAGLLTGFPLPVLAGLLGVAGLLHLGLLRDLRGVGPWAVALVVGVVGFLGHLAVGLLVGLALWWGAVLLHRLRRSP
jgi:hypothetical protein